MLRGVLLLACCAGLCSAFLLRARAAAPVSRLRARATAPVLQVAQANGRSDTVCPFRHRKLDHVVLRCKDIQKMISFYVDVLGATPEWLDRFEGTLSHLRVGDSLIDLVSMDASLAFAKGEPAVNTSSLECAAPSPALLLSACA